MAIIRTESGDKLVVAHDTLITFGVEPLKIYYDMNPNQLRTDSLELKESVIEINFKDDATVEGGQVKAEVKDGIIKVDVLNAAIASSIIGGITSPLQFASTQKGKKLYLNFAFSKVSNHYWLTYTIYLEN